VRGVEKEHVRDSQRVPQWLTFAKSSRRCRAGTRVMFTRAGSEMGTVASDIEKSSLGVGSTDGIEQLNPGRVTVASVVTIGVLDGIWCRLQPQGDASHQEAAARKQKEEKEGGRRTRH